MVIKTEQTHPICCCMHCGCRDIYMEENPPTELGFNRPLFHCRGCKKYFTNGGGGGEDADYCRYRQAHKKPHEPDHVIERHPTKWKEYTND